MTDIKQAIELLERMTAEPAPGEDARLDADELDAVLFAIRVLKAPVIKPKRMTIDKDTVEFEYIPRGEWIAREDMDYLDKNKVVHNHFECNKCGLIHDFVDGHTSQYNFCPQCGALMTSEVTK